MVVINLKNYKFKFDFWGVIVFLMFMLPTFTWLLFPVENDVLQSENRIPIINLMATVCQTIMVVLMTFFENKVNQKKQSIWIFLLVSFYVAYIIGWIFYYQQYLNIWIILVLAITPSLGFMSYQRYKNNFLALLATILFTILHVISSFIDFL